MQDLNYEQKLASCWNSMKYAADQCDWSAMRRAYWRMYWLRKKYDDLQNTGEMVIDENNTSLNI